MEGGQEKATTFVSLFKKRKFSHVLMRCWKREIQEGTDPLVRNRKFRTHLKENIKTNISVNFGGDLDLEQ